MASENDLIYIPLLNKFKFIRNNLNGFIQAYINY